MKSFLARRCSFKTSADMWGRVTGTIRDIYHAQTKILNQTFRNKYLWRRQSQEYRPLCRPVLRASREGYGSSLDSITNRVLIITPVQVAGRASQPQVIHQIEALAFRWSVAVYGERSQPPPPSRLPVSCRA